MTTLSPPSAPSPANAELWDVRYAKSGLAYGEAPNDFVAEMADSIPGGPLLCLGEGEGRNAVYLAQRGHAVTAVDQSAVGLANAQERAAQAGTSLRIIAANLADYELWHDFRELRLEHAADLEGDVQEGRYHSGRSHVVHIFARRPEPMVEPGQANR